MKIIEKGSIGGDIKYSKNYNAKTGEIKSKGTATVKYGVTPIQSFSGSLNSQGTVKVGHNIGTEIGIGKRSYGINISIGVKANLTGDRKNP